ncbi:hypothetical protein TeGR_g14997 [Tetraparma gracilis]|uniref:Uroporphyrinogen-III synthase n=1 Tax=Tetraparma gracilis TaxID=2962635 RepID=A0ABQ6NC22_9STRA|nr:hypothetical protein TeGR_g14997 [Tetraparma gracilis]
MFHYGAAKLLPGSSERSSLLTVLGGAAVLSRLSPSGSLLFSPLPPSAPLLPFLSSNPLPHPRLLVLAISAPGRAAARALAPGLFEHSVGTGLRASVVEREGTAGELACELLGGLVRLV